MRIAIFTDTFLPQVNGVTNTLGRMGEYLESKGIAYIFITPDQKKEGILPYNTESFFSYPLFIYPECRFAVPNMLRLNKRLDAFQPDVILSMTEFNMGLAGLAYGKKRKIPVVTNYSTNFGTILNSYNLNILGNALEKYLAWFHNEADMTLTPSVESQKKLENMGVFKTALFERGIDFERFDPGHRNIQYRQEAGIDDKLVLLYVGRLSPEKDLDILRDAMYRLNDKYQDQIALVITGEGPMSAELKKSMPANVLFTGYKKGKELAEIYASCDIFAFPSSFETFGNVVLEAFASGLPVVGVAEGGVKGLIKHGENGYLAEPRDVDSFVACVEKVITNEFLRKRFGTNGRAYAKTNSWPAVFDNLMDIFNSLQDTFDQSINDTKAAN